MKRRALYIVILTAAMAGAIVEGPRPARAVEGGQSPYVKGFRDFLTGVLPAPGVQVRNDVFVYSGTESLRTPQGQLNVAQRVYADIVSATVVTPYRILGGHYAFAGRFAAAQANGDRSLRTPFATIASNGVLTGFNDVVINPLMIGWHAGNFHWNIVTAVWVPVGSYDAGRLVNIGKNYWSWSPQLGATYLDPRTGWEASAAVIYLFNYENTATHYRSGDVLHIDMAVGKQIAPRLTLGVVGYLVEQITGDSGAGATLGERKAHVIGLGPAARLDLTTGAAPVALIAKYYREFAARNTTQGDAGTLSLHVSF